MRHGTQLAPDGSVPNSHELARCENGIVASRVTCESILYEVPVLLDGIPLGKVAWRCPHCHDGRPLERDALVRQRQSVALPVAPPEPAEHNLKGRTWEEHSALSRRGWETRRAKMKQEIRAALRRFYELRGRGPTFAEMGHEGRGGSVSGISNASTVRRLFGSVAAAFQEAGVPRNPRGDSGHIQPYERKKGRGMVMRRFVA